MNEICLEGGHDTLLTVRQMQWLMSDFVNALTNMSISDSGSNNALFKLTQAVISLIRGGAISGHGCKQQYLHLFAEKGIEFNNVK